MVANWDTVTGSRNTLQCSAKYTHTHTAHAHDRHRSFRAGIIICMLWERCTKVDSRALLKKTLHVTLSTFPSGPAQTIRKCEGGREIDGYYVRGGEKKVGDCITAVEKPRRSWCQVIDLPSREPIQSKADWALHFDEFTFSLVFISPNVLGLSMRLVKSWRNRRRHMSSITDAFLPSCVIVKRCTMTTTTITRRSQHQAKPNFRALNQHDAPTHNVACS